MKGRRIPHEQSAETSPRVREGGRSDRRLHVTGEHIHPLWVDVAEQAAQVAATRVVSRVNKARLLQVFLSDR